MTKGPGFSKKTIETLAKRAAQWCSNPNCFNKTSRPHSDPGKAINTGEAAHIRGAKPGSMRFDPSMTDEQRNHISNGIWLCSGCATEIDKDEERFPSKLLHLWKDRQEHYGKTTYSDIQVQEELQHLRKENIELRQQINAKENWENIKKQYQLVKTEGGAIVQKFSGNPEHYACPKCFDEERRQILQGQYVYRCPSCKTDFVIKPMKIPQKPLTSSRNLWNRTNV